MDGKLQVKGTCMEYIQDRLHKLIMNQQSNSSNATILCGDFNACYHKCAVNKMNKPKEMITTVGEGDLSDNTHQETDEHEAGESAQVVVNMNTKPPSKAFRKIGTDVKQAEGGVGAV